MSDYLQIGGIATIIICMGMAWWYLFRHKSYCAEGNRWRAIWLMCMSVILSMMIF